MGDVALGLALIVAYVAAGLGVTRIVWLVDPNVLYTYGDSGESDPIMIVMFVFFWPIAGFILIFVGVGSLCASFFTKIVTRPRRRERVTELRRRKSDDG